jgi:CO/xanthine dehydrogenase FAD-binding subunit
LSGAKRSTETAEAAGKLAAQGAKTLNFNQFKIPLLENLVRRAVRGA